MSYITTAEQLESNLPFIYNSKILAVDCETTGLDPYQDELRLLQLSIGSKTFVIDVRKVGKTSVSALLKPILEHNAIVKVLHNAKFDLKFIKHHLNIDVERIFDSFLASVITEAGISKPKGFHGLEQTVKRYLKQDIDKAEQVSDWSQNELSESQLQYAAKDASILLPLREEMIKYLQKYGLVRCAKLEFEAVLPVVWLELCGFYLDFGEWMSLAEEGRRKSSEIATEINQEVAHLLPQGNLFGELAFNLNSTQQVQKYFTEYGIPLPKSTKEFNLLPLKDKYPLVAKLLEYRGYEKEYTTFGEKFGKYINPVTGRIHAEFLQIGASTGRFACSKPNLSQIPSSKERRNCFKAENGNVLISADFSQEELRLLADFSNDVNFLAIFSKGGDFHAQTAAMLFNIPVDKVDKDSRDFAKRMNFGVTYGMGAAKFAASAGILETEARMIINNYFKAFPRVKRWLDYQKAAVLQNKYARTPSGRMTRYEFGDGNMGQQWSAQLEAANLPMQGGGADILKRSLRVFYDNSRSYHDKIKLVNIVHDQIDVESEESVAEEVQDILVNSMKSAGSEFVKKVEIKVDATINKVWQKG